MNQKHTSNSIGIDVAKAHLDAYSTVDQSARRFKNNPTGIKQLIKWASTKGKQPLLVLEPSGGYERKLEKTINDQNILMAKINAKQIRDFARAKGILAKTDAIDAQVIAEYGNLMSPRISIPNPQWQRDLKELVARRKQVLKMQSEESNRLEKCPENSMVISSIKSIIIRLREEQKALEQSIQNLITENKELNDTYQVLVEMAGIGPVVATTILAELPELGKISNKAISSLVGVAPHNVDSGNMRGTRCIKGGRKIIRNALYLAALSAKTYNENIRNFYTSLINRGKKPKVALVACIRKMIIILNAKMRDFYLNTA